MILRGYKNADWSWENGFTDPKTTEREILTTDLYQLIRKSYNLHRNNAICASISRVMVEYAGATGNFIDVPEYQDQQDFINSWGKKCTVRGDNWDRFRRQRITELVEGGGCLILFTQDADRKPNEVGLRLEVLQGGRVCTPSGRVDGEFKDGVVSYSGIAYNSSGAEVGYWYKEGDKYPYVAKYNSLGLLSAYFERSPDAEKPTSGRTVPLITPVMTQIDLVSKLERNMANWAEKVSVLGLMFETEDPQSVFAGMGMTNDDGTFKTEKILDQTTITGDVLPNQVGVVPPGTKAHIIKPEGSANFSPIFEKFQKTISSGIGIISTILFGDTNGKNFAVSKFEAQTFVRKIENWAKSLNYLDEIICRQVLAEANLRNIESFDVDATITFGGSADFEGVDPNKSADAATKRISNGTTTKSFEASKQGRDFDANVRTTIKEMNQTREIAEANGWTMEQFMAYQSGATFVSVQKDVEVEEKETNEDD
jgi:capsid protein